MADQGAGLPPQNGNFRILIIDSYSESSHVADQVAHQPPTGNSNFRFLIIDSYSETSHMADQGQVTPSQEMAILDSY